MNNIERGYLYKGGNLKFLKRITAFSKREKFIDFLKRTEMVSNALYGIHQIDTPSNKPQR